MTALSKIPGANAMGVFHDHWALGWNMPPGLLQATIYPAVSFDFFAGLGCEPIDGKI